MAQWLIRVVVGTATVRALLLNPNEHEQALVAERAKGFDVGFDHELHTPAVVSSQHKGCLGGFNMMNPSLVEHADSTFAVFRGLCITEQGNGFYRWTSSLVVGKAPTSNIRMGMEKWNWDFLRIHGDPRFQHHAKGLGECRSYAMKDISTGPEDPRFFKAHGKLYVAFIGWDIVHSTAKSEDARPACGKHAKYVFLSEVAAQGGGRLSLKEPVPLIFENMNEQEKNWGFFSTPYGASTNEVLAVYSVQPHTIVKASLADGTTRKVFSTYSEKVRALAKNGGFDPSFFHGGGIATLIKNPHSGKEYYLGVFHMHSTPAEDPGRIPYKNWAYKFSAKPPYEILDIGGQLPLVSSKNPAWGTLVQFVSSFMLVDTEAGPLLVISYGSGDRMSRTLKMSLRRFEQEFFGPSKKMWLKDTEVIDFSE